MYILIRWFRTWAHGTTNEDGAARVRCNKGFEFWRVVRLLIIVILKFATTVRAVSSSLDILVVVVPICCARRYFDSSCISPHLHPCFLGICCSQLTTPLHLALFGLILFALCFLLVSTRGSLSLTITRCLWTRFILVLIANSLHVMLRVPLACMHRLLDVNRVVADNNWNASNCGIRFDGV